MTTTDTITTDWLLDREADEPFLTAFTRHFGEAGSPPLQSVYDWLQTAAPDGGERTDWAVWLADKTITNVEWNAFSYRNGKLHGRYRNWWDNGQPLVDCTYRNGKLHGRYREWFDNGQPLVDCTYRNGNRHGLYLGWWGNGQPRTDGTYRNGKLHGRCRWWWATGQLRLEFTYRNGRQHGRCRWWHSDGQPWMDCTYEKDELITDHLQEGENEYSDGK